MKILVSYRGIPGRPGWASGDAMVRALRALGHDAIPYGTIYQTQTPIDQYWAGAPPPLGIDMLLWMECNDRDNQYTEILDLDCQTRILWDFDTAMHQDFTRVLAEHFDVVYVANWAQRRKGWRYLPYGIDAEMFHPRPKPGGRVAIIGTPFRERVEFATAVGVPVVHGLYGEDYARAVAELDIHVHHHDSGGEGLLVSRVWETLASGTVLLTQDTESVRRHFDDDVHLRLYRDAYDCRAVLSELMADDRQRRMLAASGRAEIVRRHTWVDRARAMMEDLT